MPGTVPGSGDTAGSGSDSLHSGCSQSGGRVRAEQQLVRTPYVRCSGWVCCGGPKASLGCLRQEQGPEVVRLAKVTHLGAGVGPGSLTPTLVDSELITQLSHGLFNIKRV